MPEQLLVLGCMSGIIALGSFGVAARETFKLERLQALFVIVEAEPVPERLLITVQNLGDSDGVQVQ